MTTYLKNLLLVLFSIVFAVACVEIFLRAEHKSNAEKITTEILLGENKYKFLEERSSFENVDNSIVIIGDSFTEGTSCGNANNYPGVLEDILNERGFNLGVINLGIGGTETLSYLKRMNDLFASLGSPAGFVLTLYKNDVELEPAICPYKEQLITSGLFSKDEINNVDVYCEKVASAGKQGGYSKIRTINRWMVKNIYVYRPIRELVVKAAIAIGFDFGFGGTSYLNKWSDKEGTEFKLILFSLDQMKRLAENKGVPLIVVFYPDVGFLSSKSPYTGIYRLAAGKIEDYTGLQVYSGYNAFINNENARESMTWSLSDKHPNCDAHRIFAEWVFSKLQQSGLLDN